MKSSRLIRILLLLQLNGQMSASRLADELEVSVRTVYRDAEALMMAGVPIYSTPGPAGGYRLVEGWQARLTGLTTGEAEALFLAGLPGPAAELGLGTVVAVAGLKLESALPPSCAAGRHGSGSASTSTPPDGSPDRTRHRTWPRWPMPCGTDISWLFATGGGQGRWSGSSTRWASC